MMNVTAFIPVRGGSKSIPLKNIKSFCGKPLVYWNILALQGVDSVDEIIVATDSDEIEKCVKSFSFSKVKIYNRLPANAADESSTESVILEYLYRANLSPDKYFMLVQVTSPFTLKNDFEGAINLLKNNSNLDSLLSCVKFKRFLWNKYGDSLNYDFNNRPRRQLLEGSFLENGAIYLSTVGSIINSKNRLSGKVGIYEMEEYTSLELDEPLDWFLAEQVMREYVLKQIDLYRPNIKLFLTDVDGVLTDAGMYYSESGDELKKFNTHDGMAFSLLKNAGIKTGIITSENTNIVERRAQKLQVDYLYQGQFAGGKLQAALEICEKENISLANVAYIGDDINCYDLLSSVSVAACPGDSQNTIKQINGILVLKSNGGQGAVREFVEYLLDK